MNGLRAALALAAVALSATALPPAAAGATTPSATLAQLIQDVGGRGAAANPQRYGYLAKLDSHVQAVAASRLGAGSAARAATTARSQGVTISPAGEVLVDVYVHGDVTRAADDLRALGMRVTAVSAHGPQLLVDGYLPAGALAKAAALASAKAIVTPFFRVNAGSVHVAGRRRDQRARGPGAARPGSSRRRRIGRDHLGLDRPGAERRSRHLVIRRQRRSPGQYGRPLRLPRWQRRGARHGRDRLRRGPQPQRHLLRDRQRRSGRKGSGDRRPRRARREGHRR